MCLHFVSGAGSFLPSPSVFSWRKLHINKSETWVMLIMLINMLITLKNLHF